MKRLLLLLAICNGLQISFSQNVGIGTSSPTRAKLEVHGAQGATSAIFGGESTGISLQRNWPGVGFNTYHNIGHQYMANGYAALLRLDPGTGTFTLDMFPPGTRDNPLDVTRRAIVVNALGKVNIGSADLPAATLTVARNVGLDGTAILKGTNHWSHFNAGNDENTHIRAGKNTGKVFINDINAARIVMGTGNAFVGINSGDPQFPLEIRQVATSQFFERGIILISPLNSFANWEVKVEPYLLFSFNGVAKAFISSTNGAYSAVSDARLKTNVQVLPSVLERVVRLKPVQYEMKDNNPEQTRSIGFLAQEVKAIFPELVSVKKEAEKGYKLDQLHLLDYSGFGVIAIKAIQEQQQEIEVLKKENKSLEERLRRLENILAVNKEKAL